jgi:hypothetical protein
VHTQNTIDRLTFESLKRMIELGEAELGGGVDEVDVVVVEVDAVVVVGVGEGQRLLA